MSDQALSLVLPAFNEEAVLARAVTEAVEALAELRLRFELIVVNDGSADRTGALAEALAAERPCVRVVHHDRNQGYGAALRTGFEAAWFDRVAFTDADCQFDLRDLGRMLPLTRAADVVVGYRLRRQDTRRRRFYSWGYNRLAQWLLGTGVRDIDCALKVFRADALAALLPRSRGFFVNTEMLARARQLGLRVAEVGVRHRPRAAGRSKVSLLDVPRVLGVLLPFWWRQRGVAKPRDAGLGWAATPAARRGPARAHRACKPTPSGG